MTSERINRKIISLILFLFIILISSNFVLSGKNKRAKVSKSEKQAITAERKSVANEQFKGIRNSVKLTHQCPKKEKGGENWPPEETEENLGYERIDQFKNFIRQLGNVSSETNLRLRVNLAKWNLQRKIDGMFAFAGELGEKMNEKEFLEEMEKQKSEWNEINKVAKSETNDDITCLCLMYKSGMAIIELMLKYSKKSSIRGEWERHLAEKGVSGIIEVQPPIDCIDREKNSEIVSSLITGPKINIISGENLYEFLEKSEHFRYFMCHELTNFKMVKVLLIKITTVQHMYFLENEFPEVMRVELTSNVVGLIRLEQLMAHRSGTEQHRKELLRLSTALMVSEIRLMLFQCQAAEEAAIAQQKSVLGIKSLMANAVDAVEDALRNFGSSRQLCVMLKIKKFANALVEINSIEKTITEKAVKRLGTDECEDRGVQEQMLEEAIEGKLGTEITHLIATIGKIDLGKVRKVFEHPGTKTRLLRLVGSRNRLEELDNKIGLAQKFADNAFKNDDSLWAHYSAIMLNDKIELQIHKIAADLAVFVRWLGTKFNDGKRQNALFGLIRDYIFDKIYDPIFDIDEAASLNEVERFLREKLFIETKKMVENVEKDENSIESMDFQKWKEIFENKGKKGKKTGKELQEIMAWVGKLHWTEFSRLLRNGKLMAMKKVLYSNGTEKICEKLLNLTNSNSIEMIFEEFGLKNINEPENFEAEGDSTIGKTKVAQMPFGIEMEEEQAVGNVEQLAGQNTIKSDQCLMDEGQQKKSGSKEQQKKKNGEGERGESTEEEEVKGKEEESRERGKGEKAEEGKEEKEGKAEEEKKEDEKRKGEGKREKGKEEKAEEGKEEKEGKMKKGEAREPQTPKGREMPTSKSANFKREEAKCQKEELSTEEADQQKKRSSAENEFLPEKDGQIEWPVKKKEDEQQKGKKDEFDQIRENILKQFEDEQRNAYVHIKCPQKKIPIEKLREMDRETVKDRIARELIKIYLEFIYWEKKELKVPKDEEHLQLVPLEMHAILWLLALSVEFLLTSANRLKEPLGSQFEAEITIQMILYDELKRTLSGISIIEQIFSLWKFRSFLLRNKTLWKNSENWQKFVKEHFGLFWEDEMELVDNWVEVAFDPDEAIRIYQETTSDAKILQQIIYLAIVKLIALSKEIQRVYCNLSSSEGTLGNAKRDLALLVGHELVIKLEEKFPKILEIDSLSLSVQSKLYKMYLEQKTGSEQHIITGTRLALPMLLIFVKCQTKQMPQSVGTNQKTLQQSLKEKLKQIRAQIYPKMGQAHHRIWALCILQQFINFIREIKNEEVIKMKEYKIQRWDGEEKCADVNEQMRAFNEQHFMLMAFHHKHLGSLMKIDLYEVKEFIAEKRGARTRLKKLIGEKQLALISVEHGEKMRNKEVFYDSSLKANYFIALISTDETDKVVAKLSCFISVLVRWMDSELSPANPNKNIGMNQLGKLVWPNAKSEFEDLYDEMADDSLEGLAAKSQLVRELAKGVRAFVEAKRHEKNSEKRGRRIGQKVRTNHLLTEYQQMVETARHMATQMALNGEMAEDEADEGGAEELEQWLHKAHWDTLLEFLNDDNFRVSINKVLTDVNDTEDRLKEFIGAENIATANLLFGLNGEECRKFVKVMREKEKLTEKEEERERKKRERKHADETMEQVIEEEKRKEELKKRMEEIQREKRDRKLRQRQLQRNKERETKKDNEKQRDDDKDEKNRKSEDREMSEESQSEGKSSNFAEDFIITPKNAQKGRKKRTFENKQKREEEGKEEKSEILFEKEWQKAMENTKLIDFTSDPFLNEKIYAFLQNPSETEKRQLDIGVFVNELWHRMEAIGQLTKFEGILEMEKAEIAIKREKVVKLEEKWTEMKMELAEENWIINQSQIEGVIRKLYHLLRQMLSVEEGKKDNCEEMVERNTVEKQWATVTQEVKGAKWEGNTVEQGEKTVHSVKIQLHKNKLANAIAAIEKQKNNYGEENIFEKMDKARKNSILMQLFDCIQTKKNFTSQFAEHLEGWRRLKEQQEIDRKLCEENVQFNFELTRPHLEVKFPEITQQIHVNQCENFQSKYLFTAFTNEIPKSDVDSLNVALDILKSVINEWSNGTARLVVSGSHFLGTRSSDSDIDTICVVPQKGSIGEEKAKFSGTFTCVLAIPLEQRICEDNSLYCRLCKHPKIRHLSKFPSAYLHLIQLKLFGVEFDLSLVSVPDMEFLPDEPLEPIDVELMMEVLANQRMPSEVMIKSLAGYLANHQMIGLIAERNRPKFRRFVVALKHWAKRSHIYGNIFGFFNGTILCILAAKVILWYPNGSVQFLFQKFMLIYATWNWPMPLKLTEQIGGDGAFEAFVWNPSADGQKSPMPIITPGKLAQNCANNVNESTFKILQNEMREAHLRLAKADSDSANFGQLFPPKNFIEKFHHFLLISCFVSTKYQIWQFCGFVGRKIRQQLANLDMIMGRFVHYSHVIPTKYGTNWADSDDKCPETVRLLNKDFDSLFCKFWIVGLKTKEENIGTKIEHETFLKEINEKLKSEFDTKIFNEYRAKVLKGWMNQAVKLETKYAKGDELAKFLEMK